MVQPENLFLTDTRRQVLEGEYSGSDSNLRTHHSNIRHRSQLALDELIEVARSPKINNAEALPAEKVTTLLEEVYIPLIEPEDYDDYRRDLFYELRRIIQHELERSGDE
jgi:hypothetical protein